MSPFTITGTETASLTRRTKAQSARPSNICIRVRPCTVIMRMPHPSAIRARRGALRQPSSQPSRIFRVTGIATALTVASRIRAARASSRIRAEPPCLLTIFFTGQPKLISIRAAPRSSVRRAASAMTAGSQPASCTARGASSGLLRLRLRLSRVSRMADCEAIISETTKPAPPALARRRNGRSVIPDIGARITGAAIRRPSS